MSQTITAELEVSNAEFTPRPSQIPNVMDTLYRHQLLVQQMTSRAEELRRAASFRPVMTPTPVSAATLAPTSSSLEKRSAVPSKEMTSVYPLAAVNTVNAVGPVAKAFTEAASPLVSAASNLVALVEAVKTSSVFAEMKTALTAQLPEVGELAAYAETALRGGSLATLDSYRGAITSTLASASSIVRRSHELTSGRELEATSTAIVASFSELGYGPVRIVQSGNVRVLKARKGTTAVVARIEPAGALKIDTAGFGGHDCERPVAQLIATLASHGLLVRKTETLFHGRADGGELVRETAPLFDPLVAGSSAAPEKAAAPAASTTNASQRRTLARRATTRA